MARELFIYWRVLPAQAVVAAAATAQLQAALQAEYPGLVARLYRRADERGDHVTLMETYARDGGVEAELQAGIEAAAQLALAAWCQGGRHVEAFEPWGS